VATRAIVAQENAPTELTGLTVGQRYTAQNVSTDAVLFVAMAPAGSVPPVPGTSPAFQQAPGIAATLVHGAGETVYIWSSKGTATVVLDEAP